MLISLTNRHASVVRATPDERDFLRKYLSFPDPKGHWRGKSKEDAVHRMYNEITATFASGFLPKLVKTAALDGFKIDVVDNRVVPVTKDPEADIAWLKPHQTEAINACLLKGRGIIWHPMGCLAGDTKLIVNRGGLARPFELSTIVSRLHGEATKNRAGRTCSWDLNIPSFTQSVDDDGFLRLNEIVAAHDNGIKPVFAVVLADGRTIRATEEHRFRTPDGAWVRLHELREGHAVMAATWPKSMSRQVRRTTTYRQVAHMRAHPFVQVTNSARDGHLFLVPFHRLVAEARENRISTYELIGRVLLGEIDGLTFFDPTKIHVHHKDENTRNNDPENLEVLEASEHLRRHGEKNGWKNVTGRVTPVQIAKIESCGRERVYDLTMASPMSNYVANEFLVHNSGKSEVQVALTRVLPCAWLMLAPSLSLVNNVADRFLLRNKEHGIDLGEPGRIGEGNWTEGERLTCATYQSIERALGSDRCTALLARVGGLMADESHVVPAVTFLEATASCDAYFRFGFSGTPLDRTDMKSALAIAALGPVIHKVPASRLVASKDIAKARGRFTTFRHPMPDGFTYADVYRELVIESAPRNALLVSLAKMAEKPAILFVRNIDHGRALTSMLGRAGVKAQFVWGTHKAPQIKHFVKELTRGALDVIVASAVMKQGFDIPSLRSVLFGGSGASITDTLQKLGRGSRIERDANGNIIKDEFTVYDIYDVGEQWLEKHAAARKRALLREGYEVVIEGERPRAAAARRAAISWRQE